MTVRRLPRTGAALLWVLVVLSVFGTMSAIVTKEFATARRLLAIRQNRLQAEWLARSGAEIAVARLLDDAGYTGGKLEPLPTGAINITVANDAAKPGVYRIRCEATFPTGDYRAATVAITRTATRRTEAGKVSVVLTSEKELRTK